MHRKIAALSACMKQQYKLHSKPCSLFCRLLGMHIPCQGLYSQPNRLTFELDTDHMKFFRLHCAALPAELKLAVSPQPKERSSYLSGQPSSRDLSIRDPPASALVVRADLCLMHGGACMFGLEYGNLAYCKRCCYHDKVIQRQKPAPKWQAEKLIAVVDITPTHTHTHAHSQHCTACVRHWLASTFGVSGKPLIPFPMAQHKRVASWRFWIELSLCHDLTC